MIALYKKFYRRPDKDLEKKGENIFSKASQDISTVAPIIFGIILGPTVVVSSIMSQAAFLMIANILLSIGLSLAFFNRVYQGNAKIPEILLTLGIITALFFLVLYLSPVITGWDFLGVVCFINLFASSINSFFLLRTIVLPPLLAPIQFVLGKIGVKIDIHLDKHRDLQVEIDSKNGLISDGAASILLDKNYFDSGYATQENLGDNNWRKVAIKPYKNSVDLIYGYVTRYRSSLFGEINNRKKISDCLNQVDNIVLKSSTDGSHNVLLNNKLRWKAQKVKRIYDDIEILNSKYNSYSLDQKTDFINQRFMYIRSNNFSETKQYIDILNDNINIQLDKIVALLQCYPLHVAIDCLERKLHLLTETQRASVKAQIATQEMCSLYTKENLAKFGLSGM